MTSADQDLAARHEAAKSAILAWRQLPGNTQESLAKEIQTHESEISRFISDPHYTPTTRRKKKVRLLELIEAVVGKRGLPLIRNRNPEPQEDERFRRTDYGAEYVSFRNALREIADQPAPAGLQALRTFKERALMDSGHLRMRKIANVALALSTRVETAESGAITSQLVSDSMRRCDELIAFAASDQDDSNESPYWRVAALNYLGAAMFHLGRLSEMAIDSAKTVAPEVRCVDLLKSSLEDFNERCGPPEKKVIFAINAVEVLESYFETNAAAAQLACRQLFELSESSRRSIRVALEACRCPNVKAVYNSTVPVTIPLNEEERTMLTRYKSIAASAVLALLLMVNMIRGDLRTVDTCDVDCNISAIRGDL